MPTKQYVNMMAGRGDGTAVSGGPIIRIGTAVRRHPAGEVRRPPSVAAFGSVWQHLAVFGSIWQSVISRFGRKMGLTGSTLTPSRHKPRPHTRTCLQEAGAQPTGGSSRQRDRRGGSPGRMGPDVCRGRVEPVVVGWVHKRNTLVGAGRRRPSLRERGGLLTALPCWRADGSPG